MAELSPASKQNIRMDNTLVKFGMSKLEYGKFSLNHDGVPYVVTGQDDLYTTTELTYVHVADIGTGYVTGSEGRVKTIKEFRTDYDTTNKAKLTTLTYTDATYPTKVTGIAISVADIV